MNTKDTYTEVYMGVFMQKNKRKVGAFYEEIAADYLVSQGVMILERNYRNWLGEIDLIGMTADGWLIFVEVKYRSSERFRKSAGSSERQKAAGDFQGGSGIFEESLQKHGCEMQV